MSLDRKLQCKSTYSDHQLWHVKRICSSLPDEKKAELLLQIQAKANLFGDPIENKEAYEVAIKLLKKEDN